MEVVRLLLDRRASIEAKDEVTNTAGIVEVELFDHSNVNIIIEIIIFIVRQDT